MYPAKFEYFRANSVREAIQLLQDHSGSKLLAGGHSLIPMMKLRLAQPGALIDIGHVSELAGITENNGAIRIGALTTHTELVTSALLKQRCPLLSEAAAQIADPQVRNRGTIGGNLAHADPGSDLPAVVLALDAVFHLSGPGGDRTSKASDFFLDLFMTDLQPEEILIAVEMPALPPGSGSCYLKFEHPASGYAVCGVAAVMRLDAGGSCQSAALAINGVTAAPHKASGVADALKGKTPEDGTIHQAVDEHLEFTDPMGDLYASASYRVELARVYSKRALKAARDRARK